MPKISETKYLVMMEQDEAPHLSKKEIDAREASTPPYLRDARRKGIPSMGAGAIYPVPESEILIDPFPIPDYWPRAAGMDVGWNRTACVWGAKDRNTGIKYLYSEYYKGEAEPSVHAHGIRARGEWIPIAIDPAARGRGQRDGEQLFQNYLDLGLNLIKAENAVESGLYEVWQGLSEGSIKVFNTLQNWIMEYRLYRRDEKGKIVKENDHLMDACFHGDTKIITSNGLVKIKDITNKHLVLTPDGYQSCSGAYMTRGNADVIELGFSDGSRVICTPDHKFVTKRGWIQAIDMVGHSCYTEVSRTINREQPCLSEPYQRHARNSTGKDITYAASISREMELDYTALSGNGLIIGKFLGDIVFITSMKIVQTTIQTISSLCAAMSICRYMQLGGRVQTIMQESTPQKHGINRMKVKHGIKNITKNIKNYYIKKVYLNAKAAGKNTNLKSQEQINFVQTIANLHGAESNGSTMKKEHAGFAGKSSNAINTFQQKHAAKNVKLKCLSLKEKGKSDVYCIGVPSAGMFALANSAFVSNCRYLQMTGFEYAIIKPKPRRDVLQEYRSEQNKRTGY